MREYTREMLVFHLKKAAAELGHTPSEHELNKLSQTKKYPSSTTYIKRFSSWNNALKAAYLNIRKVKQYSKEELIAKLKELHGKTHHVPTLKYLSKHKTLPHHRIFVKAFGSWENALGTAGIPLNKYSKRYSKKDLLMHMQKLKSHLNAIPTTGDLKKVPNMPSATTYFRRFKTWERVLVEAKVIPKQTTLKEY